MQRFSYFETCLSSSERCTSITGINYRLSHQGFAGKVECGKETNFTKYSEIIVLVVDSLPYTAKLIIMLGCILTSPCKY